MDLWRELELKSCLHSQHNREVWRERERESMHMLPVYRKKVRREGGGGLRGVNSYACKHTQHRLVAPLTKVVGKAMCVWGKKKGAWV